MNQHEYDKKAYLSATPMQRDVVRRLLCEVLACLRAQYLSYQTSHWQVVGGAFYGNHLLFERLYKSVQGQVDALAEKIAGYLGGEVLDLNKQIETIYNYTLDWGRVSCHHERGLQSEEDLQEALRVAYEGIKVVNAMTLGLDDWLMATANEHESNTYLLQQSLAKPPVEKEASGAPTGEGHFYDDPEKKEVLEFANSNAISNIVSVAEKASEEDHLDIPESKAVAEAEEAPPPPTEIADEPGGSDFSTLNRYVIKTEAPGGDSVVKMNEKRMAAWLKQLGG